MHPNVNVYGAGTAIRTNDTELGFQAGVIGHVPLTEKVNGFAKAGWGNDIKQTYQVGAQYEVRPDVDLNVYYGYDKYSVNSNDKNCKRFTRWCRLLLLRISKTTLMSGLFCL